MATTTFQINNDLFSGFRRFGQRVTARGLWLGLILLAALVAFELFNFATTEFALQSLFGTHDVLGLTTWAKVLAIAFCGIDFAGLSRLFTPETGRKEPREIWLLTGAWLLGAGMNAVMTWWAVTSALAANPVLGNELISRADILRVGPVFIAALVWFTRVLIIGTFAFAGDHIFSTAGRHSGVIESHARPVGSSRPAPPSAYPPAQPRAVPKPSERRSLPERSTPLASSTYARQEEAENSRYGAGRSFFGSGAGSYREPAAAATVTPPTASAPAAQPARPVNPRPTAFDGPSARAGSMPLQATGSMPLQATGSMQSQATGSMQSQAPGSGASSRASTTRTISPEPERPAVQTRPAAQARPAAESRPAMSRGGAAAMELEYVDLD